MKASASVQSVPGRTGSQISASAATCVRRGSMTTSDASVLENWMMARQNAELSDCAGLVPHMNRHSVKPGVMSASTVHPNVSASIQMRGFQQIWPIPMLLGLPNRFMKRWSGQNDACGPPMALASVSGPC